MPIHPSIPHLIWFEKCIFIKGLLYTRDFSRRWQYKDEQSRKDLSSQKVHILVGRKTVNKTWTNKKYHRVISKGKKGETVKVCQVVRNGLSERWHQVFLWVSEKQELGYCAPVSSRSFQSSGGDTSRNKTHFNIMADTESESSRGSGKDFQEKGGS